MVKGDVATVSTWCPPQPPHLLSPDPWRPANTPCTPKLPASRRPARSAVSPGHPSLGSADIRQREPWKSERSPTHLELQSQL